MHWGRRGRSAGFRDARAPLRRPLLAGGGSHRGTYGGPLLGQPAGAVEGVAGLQDLALGRVQALPLVRGRDHPLHVLFHAGHRAALDAAPAGSGAGSPGAALPPGKEERLAASAARRRGHGDRRHLPRQRVVEVVGHDLLVSVTAERKRRASESGGWGGVRAGGGSGLTWPGRAPGCTPGVWAWA